MRAGCCIHRVLIDFGNRFETSALKSLSEHKLRLERFSNSCHWQKAHALLPLDYRPFGEHRHSYRPSHPIEKVADSIVN